MGGAGNLPASVGNLPTEMAAWFAVEQAPGLFLDDTPIPSGKLPDGTGW